MFIVYSVVDKVLDVLSINFSLIDKIVEIVRLNVVIEV